MTERCGSAIIISLSCLLSYIGVSCIMLCRSVNWMRPTKCILFC